jgi:hypothetical protein
MLTDNHCCGGDDSGDSQEPLQEYSPSERRAVLYFRKRLEDRLNRPLSVRDTKARWENGPAPKWRKKKQSIDCELQRREIEIHKYLRSEKVGRDIGESTAAAEWIRLYARSWRDWWEKQLDASLFWFLDRVDGPDGPDGRDPRERAA